jgi:dimethylhistidine N-methyltransferase
MTETAVSHGGVTAKERIFSVVREGLTAQPKRLPPWLFYDEAGSRLFERITELPEYYLTRTEREILTSHAGAMIALAAEDKKLCIVELGAGSAEKTRLLLASGLERQSSLLYEPVDLSPTALEAARERIEREIPGVRVAPRLEDYTHGLKLDPASPGERRLVLYIGSSIGNFDPAEARRLLEGVRGGLEPGDGLLLGVDLVKDESPLLAAYDDAAGVTAAFNRNLLARLNRELEANFDLDRFAHRAIWNRRESRIEMHLASRFRQRVRIKALDGAKMDGLGPNSAGRPFEVEFAPGESIHTENSYKYLPGQAEAMLAEAGFAPIQSWTDERGWFAVCLGRAG